MSYQVLARKWRPRRFEDVIGQEHITKSLQNAIERGSLGHAFLLTGTRGIGKTSVARILAKAICCESPTSTFNPCLECPSCKSVDSDNSLNVLEIDGASNNSVDDIRQLVENIQYLPTTGKYKLYIIDEVHMLSTSAFNALLKTLEEPPAHVKFIFATTEPAKLLPTVLSRCQRFDFRNLSESKLVDHIKHIAKEEGITFENEHLVQQIATLGNGSARDTLSLLDQVLSYSEDKHITEDVVVAALGLAHLSAMRTLLSSIVTGNEVQMVQAYRKMLDENVDLKNIAKGLLDHLYFCIENIDEEARVYSQGFADNGVLSDISAPELFWLYESLAKDTSWVLESISPDKVYEVVLRRLTKRRDFFLTNQAPVHKEAPRDNVDRVDPVEAQVVESETEAVSVAEEDVVTEKPIIEPKKNVEKTWDAFLVYLREQAPAVVSNLEQGNYLAPVVAGEDGVVVKIGFSSASKIFMDYLSEPDVISRLEDMVCEYFEVVKSKVEIDINYVDEKEREESNFQSQAELEEEKEKKRLEEVKNDFLTSPMLLEAEKLFNTKVDKFIHDEKKN